MSAGRCLIDVPYAMPGVWAAPSKNVGRLQTGHRRIPICDSVEVHPSLEPTIESQNPHVKCRTEIVVCKCCQSTLRRFTQPSVQARATRNESDRESPCQAVPRCHEQARFYWVCRKLAGSRAA